MRAVIQRVSTAGVTINGHSKATIGTGMMILIGIEEADTAEDIAWLSRKIVNLRIFDDDAGVMNLSVKEVNGEILLISQFTLHALTAKGNRPSYIKAARPEQAIPLYNGLIDSLEQALEKKIQTGEFGADMQVSLINNGPVTLLMDTKNKE